MKYSASTLFMHNCILLFIGVRSAMITWHSLCVAHLEIKLNIDKLNIIFITEN